MTELFWTVRYALYMFIVNRGSIPLYACWQCATTGWTLNQGYGVSPSEAVRDEMSYWTE